MPPVSYARHQFPAVLIQHAVWLYLRFTLTYRDVEDLLAERGVEVSYQSVRRWVLKFGPVADEVAERLKAEAALRQAQKMEAVRQLTGGIAHDYNNLLTAIGGNLELIERSAADERTRHLAAAAQRASERAARLTAQLLAFSRRQTLCPEIVDAGKAETIKETPMRISLPLLRRALGEIAEMLAGTAFVLGGFLVVAHVGAALGVLGLLTLAALLASVASLLLCGPHGIASAA